MGNAKMIGIVGGMGPHAGLAFAQKLLSLTPAKSDQEHLSMVILSCPSEIADRSAFLLGRSTENPAFSIARVVLKLETLGAELIALPCNTSHSPAIYKVILEELGRQKSKARLLNMVEECVTAAKASGLKRIGLLATAGTYADGVYEKALGSAGLATLIPDKDSQNAVHDAIYNPAYGLKAQASPPSQTAFGLLSTVIRQLKEKGADSILLACTELPLAITKENAGIALLDSTEILARAVLRESLT